MSEIVHELLPEGESTAKWAIREPGFFGSIKQLLCCARCGETIRGGPNKAVRYRDVFKPTMHCLCDECHEALPPQPDEAREGSQSQGADDANGTPPNPSFSKAEGRKT